VLRMVRRLSLLLVVTSLVVPQAVSAAPGKADPPDPGTLRQFPYATTVTQNDTYALGQNSYLVYTPASYQPAKPVPLVVMVHGCNTTAMDQAKANRFHPLAEREKFVVLYPDVPATQPLRCWKWYDPQSQQRDSGDPAIIAGMTRQVMKNWNIDPQRVYIIGMSSGAMMTSNVAASYPDLYAAAGIMAGCAYRAVPCLDNDAYPMVEPVDQEAQLARDQMGPRARIMPVIVLHGDADKTVPYQSGLNAFRQWLQTDNLIAGGAATGPFSMTPSKVRKGSVRGGYTYTVEQHNDPQGCLALEKWTIHGMDHFWSGGTQDPAYYGWEDPKGPSAAEATWAFFRRYRMSQTSLPCVEAKGSR
jgi:poly(hydroxyalkanoate) depolymerase family esterase